jgi:prolyl-tRNA synthetase
MAKELKELCSRSENYSQWYNDLVNKADLAENSAVRGCMVIKPYGYSIWEKMQAQLDKMFKETGHQNAYFPLFIPKSFLSREAEHVEGFAKECAVVTHYRLKKSTDGDQLIVDPEAKLEEELIVRPTRKPLFGTPIKTGYNLQRFAHFVAINGLMWFAGNAHQAVFCAPPNFCGRKAILPTLPKAEAEAEALTILKLYADFAEQYMAMPVLTGVKTANERFAGALETYTIEALMQDGKALQSGTSHFLGQNFAKAFDVTFLNKENKLDYVWATSWGVSTRLMGALIMSHSDDNGLVLPPALAPFQVVIVPIYKNAEQLKEIDEKVASLMLKLKELGISVRYDNNDNKKPGWKFAEYELKGVPVRLALGARDLQNNSIEVARRDTLSKETRSMEGIELYVKELLDDIQQNIYQKALDFRTKNTFEVNSYDEFKEKIEEGGFLSCHWDGSSETEERVKYETKATIRCIPLDGDQTPGTCIFSGKPSARRVIFARAY